MRDIGLGNIKKVEAIGRDYLVYSETGMTYYLYINQVKLVTVRPGGRIIDPLNKSDLDTPDDFYEPGSTPPAKKKPIPQKIEPLSPEEEQNPFWLNSSSTVAGEVVCVGKSG